MVCLNKTSIQEYQLYLAYHGHILVLWGIYRMTALSNVPGQLSLGVSTLICIKKKKVTVDQ